MAKCYEAKPEAIELSGFYTDPGERMVMYREYFYFVDLVHGSVLRGGQCAACCKSHTNFADESACLMADNVWNEGK
jgi:hypothetical protein